MGQKELEALQQRIDGRADGTIAVRLEIVGGLPLTPRGKRKRVDQHLDLAEYGLVEA